MEALRQKIREEKEEAKKQQWEEPKDDDDEEYEKEEESDQERYNNDNDDTENLPPFIRQEFQSQYAWDQEDEVGRVHNLQDSYDPEYLVMEAEGYQPEVRETNEEFESELLLDLEHHLEREQEADTLRVEKGMQAASEIFVGHEFLQVESDVESDVDSLFRDMSSQEENVNEFGADLEEVKNNKMREMLLEMAEEVKLPAFSRQKAEGGKPKEKVLTGRVVKISRRRKASDDAFRKNNYVKEVKILSINEEDYIDWGEGDDI